MSESPTTPPAPGPDVPGTVQDFAHGTAATGSTGTIAAAALLLDLDGTLVDSVRTVERSWRAAVERLGVPFDQVMPYIHGLPAHEALRRAFPTMAENERAQLAEQVLAFQAADPGTRLAPGARVLLDTLSRDPGRWAIVTSGDRRLARATMRKTGVPEPGVLVTADDVTAGKPDPQPYLVAARRLKVAPEDCVAVEDSPAGVLSAKAAGMAVIGVTTTFPDLPGAARLVAGLDSVRVSGTPGAVLLNIDEVVRAL